VKNVLAYLQFSVRCCLKFLVPENVPENCCIEVEAEFADRTIETLDDIFATGLAFVRQAKFYVDA
jgi:hypothetical protein